MFYSKKEPYLPYSGNRYKLNDFGEILDDKNNVIEVKIIDGKKFVELSWIFGKMYYEIASIICIIFYKINIPTHHWNKIEAIYEDDDYLNTNICNISYRFKDGPIELDNCPGFYYVPYYTNYAISKDGKLIKISDNKIRNWLISKYRDIKNVKGGYRNCRAYNDMDTKASVSRHRAIGLTFVKYNKNPLKLVINHKDGEPRNDNPENLEWVTRAQNNQHAYDNNLLPNKVIKIVVKDLKTNMEIKFKNIATCARYYNKSHGFIVSRLNKNNIRYSDGLVFKKDDGSEWPKLSDFTRTATITKQILGRNIFTGEVFLYDNSNRASEETDVTSKNVYYHARYECVKPINGFNFRFNSENVKWPSFNKEQLEVFKLLLENH